MSSEQRLWVPLPASTSAPRQARHAVIGFLREHHVRDVDVLVLVVSELATNAVVHGGGGELALELRDHVVRVEVTDHSPEPPVVRTPDDNGHRGLPIIEQVSCAWGISPAGGGKTVWCELPLPA